DQKIHAKFRLLQNSADDLTWDSEEHSGRDVIELWFKSCDEYRFRVRDPDQVPSDWVDRAHPHKKGIFWELRSSRGSKNQYELTYTSYHYDNGDSSLTIFINCGNAGNQKITGGTWTLEIESGAVKSGSQESIHAWIEPMSFVQFILPITTVKR